MGASVIAASGGVVVVFCGPRGEEVGLAVDSFMQWTNKTRRPSFGIATQGRMVSWPGITGLSDADEYF